MRLGGNAGMQTGREASDGPHHRQLAALHGARVLQKNRSPVGIVAIFIAAIPSKLSIR